MIRLILGFFLNVIVFIVLRYLNILFLFLKGIDKDAAYSMSDYFPSLFFQILLIMVLGFLDKKKGRLDLTSFIMYILLLITTCLLFIGSHFRWIPHSIIPY